MDDIAYLHWPREPIEAHIDLHGFKGWRGESWLQTKENAAKTAQYLLDKEPSSKRITTQLSTAISRIHLYQVASILVLLTDLAAPLLLKQVGYNIMDPTNWLAAYALLTPPGLLSVINVLRLDRRKYFYREIIQSVGSITRPSQQPPSLEKTIS